MSQQKNDLMQNDDHTDPQKWLDYLDGKLPLEQRQLLEKEIAQSEFLRDALEGLHPLKNTVDLDAVVNHLNQQLKQQLAPRKRRRKRRAGMAEQKWGLLAILVILGLCLLGYSFYWYMHQH